MGHVVLMLVMQVFGDQMSLNRSLMNRDTLRIFAIFK